MCTIIQEISIFIKTLLFYKHSAVGYIAKKSNYCHCFLFFACELQVMPRIKKYLTLAKRFPNSCRVIVFRKKSLVLKGNDLIRSLIWEQWFDLQDNDFAWTLKLPPICKAALKLSLPGQSKNSLTQWFPTILNSGGDLFRMHFCEGAPLAYL